MAAFRPSKNHSLDMSKSAIPIKSNPLVPSPSKRRDAVIPAHPAPPKPAKVLKGSR